MPIGIFFAAMLTLAAAPAVVTDGSPRELDVAASSQTQDTGKPGTTQCSCSCLRRGKTLEGISPNPNSELDLGETAHWPAY